MLLGLELENVQKRFSGKSVLSLFTHDPVLTLSKTACVKGANSTVGPQQNSVSIRSAWDPMIPCTILFSYCLLYELKVAEQEQFVSCFCCPARPNITAYLHSPTMDDHRSMNCGVWSSTICVGITFSQGHSWETVTDVNPLRLKRNWILISEEESL